MSEPRDAEFWARPIEKFEVRDVQEGVVTGNVEGRRPTGPLQGFGQLWQKTYEISIPGHTPEQIIEVWKARFGDFWHPLNEFHPSATGIAPGEIAIIGGGKGPAKVTTGVRVIYADDRSWTYMTPEGHPWAAIITFSAHDDEAGDAVARVHLMVRSSDPLYEVGFRLFTSRLEDKIWTHTLTALGRHFGSDAPVSLDVSLVDRRRQWDQFWNIRQNSAIRSLLRRDRRPSRMQ